MKNLLPFLFLVACDKPSSSPPSQTPAGSATRSAPAPVSSSAVNVAAAKAAVAQGAKIIDVRTPEEWDGGHLDTATLIPLDSLGSRLTDVAGLVQNDKTKPIVVVCRSGGRAGKAQEQLTAAGYTNVTNGGAWQNLQ